MHTKLRNIAIFSLLAAAAAATWVGSRPLPTPAPDRSAGAALPLGYYLRDAVLLGTDRDGRIYYRVYADLVEQASRGDDLVLRQVRVEYEPDTEVRWSLTADEGTAPSNRAYLDLLRSVRLTSSASDDREVTIIETESLRLDVDGFLASSDQDVAVHRGKSLLRATGVKAHLKDDLLELPNVSARFTP